MLDSLRGYATGWFAQILMGLLVLSFGAWGVNDVFNGFRSNDVAMVGSTAITIVDFQRDYQQAVENLSRQVGQAITPEQAQQFGVPNQIIGRLVSQATLDNAAGKMGLGISNDQLGKKIAANPQFAGSGGTFDRNVLSQVVRQYGFTDNDYILSQRHELVRGQLAQAFAGGVVAPAAYLRAVHEYNSEERNVSYFVVTAPAATEIADPSDADLNTYFAAHKDEWKAPEVRAISYFALTPADVAQVDEVSDADAQKAYDAQPARFVTEEKRKVEQIVFKDRAEADQAAVTLAAGTTFDQLMTERKLRPSDVDLGLVTKDKIVDPAIADAAFALPANGVSPVTDGQFGPAILRVTEIDPKVETSFDAAKADLKKEIATQRALTEVSATHDAIEDARAAGGTLAEIAAKYGVKLLALPAVDSNGNDADGNAIANLPNGLIAGAFQSDIGNPNDPLQPDANSYLWYDVTAVTAPRERPLAEVHDKVIAAWKDAERQKRLTEKADGAKQRLDSKDSLATVAADLGGAVKTATKLTRATKATDDLPAAAIAAAFGGPNGSVVVADGAQPMTHLVLVVDSVTVPEFIETAPDLAASKQTLDGQFINAFLTLYVGQLQSQTKVTFNQVALQQVLGATGNSN